MKRREGHANEPVVEQHSSMVLGLNMTNEQNIIDNVTYVQVPYTCKQPVSKRPGYIKIAAFASSPAHEKPKIDNPKKKNTEKIHNIKIKI